MNTVTDGDLLDTLEQAVRQGNPITVPVSGVSMGARFARVDAIVISPAAVSTLGFGMIIVYRRKNKLVAHRVVRVLRDSGKCVCVTKGDGVNRLDDPPVSESEYIGVVTAVESGGKTTAQDRRHRLHGLMVAAFGLARVVAASVVRLPNAARQKGTTRESGTKPRS